MRLVVALGGNAMTSADGRARPEDQIAAVSGAMEHVADLVVAGHEVLLTHGNGPQVGNLLVKNELAAHVVPPVPLDWCGAQTQGTVGAMVLDALDAALRRRSQNTPVAALVTRTIVDGADEGFHTPTKPIGRYLPADQARRLVEHGQTWQDRGEHGWRRVVASPEPLEVLEVPAIRTLLGSGFVVVAAGGGGVPTVRDPDGTLRGVEAVIDKDLTAALLAAAVEADALVIATDVDHAAVDFGSPRQRDLGRVSIEELRGYAAEGQFTAGSMGPKVEAALRAAASGRLAVITSLHHIDDALGGRVGTVVEPHPSAPPT